MGLNSNEGKFSFKYLLEKTSVAEKFLEFMIISITVRQLRIGEIFEKVRKIGVKKMSRKGHKRCKLSVFEGA